MITIFTIPKPFVGHIGIIQENAIRSWLTLIRDSDIILFGNEAGTEDCAHRHGLSHQPEISTNEYGTPLLSDVFQKATAAATDFVCYVNCDIILTRGILHALSTVQQAHYDKFLVVGRRVDVNIDRLIDFTDDWEERTIAYGKDNGRLHGHSGIDYLLFPRPMYHEIPPFAVGRVGWDNWMIYHAIHLGIPVIDITPSFLAIHQNHDYSHLNDGVRQRDSGEEANLNLRLAGGRKNMYSIRDATHQLTRNKIEKRKDTYRIYRWLVTNTGLDRLIDPFIVLRRMVFRLIG